jgi:hypothetical protein
VGVKKCHAQKIMQKTNRKGNMLRKSHHWAIIKIMKSLSIYQEIGILAASEHDVPGVRELASTPGRHLYHHHVHLWDYCNPRYSRPFADSGDIEVFASPPPGTTLAQAQARTRLLVFIGAGQSPEMLATLDRTDGVCLVFEPGLARLDAFLFAWKPHELARRAVFFVGGDPDRLDVPLLSMLPEDICQKGYPLFFVQEGLAEALPDYVRRVEELVELFYYRNIIYQLDSQENVRGLPLRPMARDVIYDRYKHLYENLEPGLGAGTLKDLLGALTGRTAILCAAGPALQDNLDYIRENKDRAVVIAVNNALKPLLAAGVEPHFVVINDTSVDSEVAFTGLASLPNATLVAHCLSGTGGGIFPRLYFFGNFPGQPFPKRDSLLLHGSVITTAFALAEYLGCSKALLSGVQLGSPDPMALNYAKSSAHEAQRSGADVSDLPGRWPQLYPAQTADGRSFYTTLNFFDAAQWFADRIRMASLDVVNLCPGSILKGPGITQDPAPKLPEAPGLDAALDSLPRSDFSGRRDRVLGFVRQEMARWKGKQLAARAAATSPGHAAAFIAESDQDNTSFMLQRFADFDNARFHTAYFDAPDEAARTQGAAYFLEYMERMCKELLAILLDQHKRVSSRD